MLVSKIKPCMSKYKQLYGDFVVFVCHLFSGDKIFLRLLISLEALGVKPNRFNRFVERVFGKLEAGYKAVLRRALNWRWAAPIIIIACMGGSYGLMQQVPSQLTPQEDLKSK